MARRKKSEASTYRYIAMRLNYWDGVMAITPAPLPIDGCGKSVGFMLAYDSLEALREDYPDSDYVTVKPAPKEETTNPKGGASGKEATGAAGDDRKGRRARPHRGN